MKHAHRYFVLLVALALFVGSLNLAGPKEPKRTMPSAGRNGVEYCFTFPGHHIIVNVPNHPLSVEKRIELNGLHAGPQGPACSDVPACSIEAPCSTDPGVIVKEYREAARGAIRKVAAITGAPEWKKAAEGRIVFPALGDEISPEGDDTIVLCYKSNCYQQPQPCTVTACRGLCADCNVVYAPGGSPGKKNGAPGMFEPTIK